jgi:hypothetical protein
VIRFSFLSQTLSRMLDTPPTPSDSRAFDKALSKEAQLVDDETPRPERLSAALTVIAARRMSSVALVDAHSKSPQVAAGTGSQPRSDSRSALQDIEKLICARRWFCFLCDCPPHSFLLYSIAPALVARCAAEETRRVRVARGAGQGDRCATSRGAARQCRRREVVWPKQGTGAQEDACSHGPVRTSVRERERGSEC